MYAKNSLVHFKFIAQLPGTHFGVVKCLQKSFPVFFNGQKCSEAKEENNKNVEAE